MARRGWYAFSHDFNIVVSKTQTKMVLSYKSGLFIVRGKSKERAHHIMGTNVANTKLAIDRFVKKNGSWNSLVEISHRDTNCALHLHLGKPISARISHIHAVWIQAKKPLQPAILGCSTKLFQEPKRDGACRFRFNGWLRTRRQAPVP